LYCEKLDRGFKEFNEGGNQEREREREKREGTRDEVQENEGLWVRRSRGGDFVENEFYSPALVSR
jgi:hypothetical protein